MPTQKIRLDYRLSTMNKAQIISAAVAPMATGSISFGASLTTIICIFRSDLKLSTTYRRLIFALSVFDLPQSLFQALSSSPMPVGTMWAAAGNNVTCTLQGFFIILGTCGTIWYSLSLSIYFLLVVKFNLPDQKITKTYEPFLHAFPILYSTSISIYTYATHNINPSGPICWIDSRPSGCEDDPDVDCISIGSKYLLQFLGVGIPFVIVFVLNCILMGVLWWTVKTQIKKSQSYRYSWIIGQGKNQDQSRDHDQEEEEGNNLCSKGCQLLSCCPFSPCNNKKGDDDKNLQNVSPLAARLSRPSRSAVQKMKEICHRAFAYIIGYLLTYSFSFISRLIAMAGTGSVPFVFIFLARFFYPLQVSTINIHDIYEYKDHHPWCYEYYKVPQLFYNFMNETVMNN